MVQGPNERPSFADQPNDITKIGDALSERLLQEKKLNAEENQKLIDYIHNDLAPKLVALANKGGLESQEEVERLLRPYLNEEGKPSVNVKLLNDLIHIVSGHFEAVSERENEAATLQTPAVSSVPKAELVGEKNILEELGIKEGMVFFDHQGEPVVIKKVTPAKNTIDIELVSGLRLTCTVENEIDFGRDTTENNAKGEPFTAHAAGQLVLHHGKNKIGLELSSPDLKHHLKKLKHRKEGRGFNLEHSKGVFAVDIGDIFYDGRNKPWKIVGAVELNDTALIAVEDSLGNQRQVALTNWENRNKNEVLSTLGNTMVLMRESGKKVADPAFPESIPENTTEPADTGDAETTPEKTFESAEVQAMVSYLKTEEGYPNDFFAKASIEDIENQTKTSLQIRLEKDGHDPKEAENFVERDGAIAYLLREVAQTKLEKEFADGTKEAEIIRAFNEKVAPQQQKAEIKADALAIREGETINHHDELNFDKKVLHWQQSLKDLSARRLSALVEQAREEKRTSDAFIEGVDFPGIGKAAPELDLSNASTGFPRTNKILMDQRINPVDLFKNIGPNDQPYPFKDLQDKYSKLPKVKQEKKQETPTVSIEDHKKNVDDILKEFGDMLK